MQVMSIVGARPQFVKLAPIAWSSKNEFEHRILHTGQHYDPMLSESFFTELNIPEPDFQLLTGSGLHGEQTGKMIIEIENILINNRPDHVIVYGDTNSTLAGAIAASKLHIPISHIEAGLRSHNRQMPEEINRVIVDHCSDLLFAPTETSMKNLRMEGLENISFQSGDVMLETINHIKTNQLASAEGEDYIFATIHRAENTDTPQRVTKIIADLRKSLIPVHLHCHPRLKKVISELGIDFDSENLKILPPLDYFSTIKKVHRAQGVITDSGGLQKESYILKIPCLVVRTESEWVETLASGANFLDPDLKSVSKSWWVGGGSMGGSEVFGDGNSSQLIVHKIKNYNSSST
jgi:UDP-N-acetylglucosamine 2-epimerase